MTEWNNLKYTLMEELGENMDITVFRQWSESGAVECFVRSHAEMDGVGSFCDVLEQEEGLEQPEQPMRNAIKIPNRWKQAWLAMQFYRLSRQPSPVWKPEVDFEITGPSDGFCFYVLDADQTRTLAEMCAPRGTSLTALMLKTLDSVVAPTFLLDPSERTWVIPTNMRGAVTREQVKGNYSTSTLVRISDSDSVEDIYGKMKSFLDRDLIWGSWVFTNLPKFMSVKRYRSFVHGTRNAAFASLSNMGQWPLPGMQVPDTLLPLDRCIWSGAPPSSRVVPINATSGIWGGRLVLVLKLHPSLQAGLDETRTLLGNWLQALAERVDSLQVDRAQVQTVTHQQIYGASNI